MYTILEVYHKAGRYGSVPYLGGVVFRLVIIGLIAACVFFGIYNAVVGDATGSAICFTLVAVNAHTWQLYEMRRAK